MSGRTRCRAWWLILGLTLGVGAGCEPDRPAGFRDPPTATLRLPVQATCTAQVVGVGAVDTESDYLPHVVKCENGGADLEALKAQAVAARSVLYYKMATAGSIRDGTSDQVYTCGREPGPEHYQAVAETAGQMLTYGDVVIFAFYVAGAIPSTASCVPAAGDSDPTSTERWVTYNQGRSGNDVEQTPLGWVDDGNLYNRGCKSQNGAHCLAEHGWNYRDILAFYYGSDATIVTAEGACVQQPDCTGNVSGAVSVLDDGDRCFSRGACASWKEEARGQGGHLWWTHAWDGEVDCSARWSLDFAAGGPHRLAVWIDDFGTRSRQVPYLVRHAGQQTPVVLSQDGVSGWVSLGSFDFAAGGDQWVQLTDATGEPFADRRQILVDALRLLGPGACLDDGECDDSNPCNGVERCVDGGCQPGPGGDCPAADLGPPDPVDLGTPDPVDLGTPDPVDLGTPDPVDLGTPDPVDSGGGATPDLGPADPPDLGGRPDVGASADDGGPRLVQPRTQAISSELGCRVGGGGASTPAGDGMLGALLLLGLLARRRAGRGPAPIR